MEKIDLFIIVAFEKQTQKLLSANGEVLVEEARGRKKHVSTMSRHIYTLSKYFNLRSFFDYRDSIESFPNPVIYHIPYGLDNVETGVESALLEFKGRVPVFARSYDPHSPVKMSKEYLTRHHDFVFSFYDDFFDDQRFWPCPMVYDNFVVGDYEEAGERSKLCCMVLGNKYTPSGPKKSGYEIFDHKDMDIKNIYPERDNIAQDSRLEVYGHGWSYSMPNYKGALSPFVMKYKTSRKYKFAIAMENCEMRTWISEKIMDAFLTLNVPVYLGAPNVADHIPGECFVDMRQFASYGELFDYLESMSEDVYSAYIAAIKKYRRSMFEKFSTFENIVAPMYSWYRDSVAADIGWEGMSLDYVEGPLRGMRLVDEGSHLMTKLRRAYGKGRAKILGH